MRLPWNVRLSNFSGLTPSSYGLVTNMAETLGTPPMSEGDRWTGTTQVAFLVIDQELYQMTSDVGRMRSYLNMGLPKTTTLFSVSLFFSSLERTKEGKKKSWDRGCQNDTKLPKVTYKNQKTNQSKLEIFGKRSAHTGRP